VLSRISQRRLKYPILCGFASYFIGQTILILVPEGAALAGGAAGYAVLCVSLFFDGLGLAIVGMLADSLVAIFVDEKERARAQAMIKVMIMFVSAPFGWIGGLLSNMSRELPFVMNLVIMVAGATGALLYYRKEQRAPE